MSQPPEKANASSTFRPSPGHHRTVSELVNEMEATSGENAKRQEATPQPARPPIIAQHNNNNSGLPPSQQIPATLSSAFPPIAGLPRPQLQFGGSLSQVHPQSTPQPTTPINRLAPAQPAPSATSSTGIVPPASNPRSHTATPSTIARTNAGLFSSVSPAVLPHTPGSASTPSTSTPQDRQAVASNFSALRNIMNRRIGGSQTPQSKPSYGMPQSRTSGSPAPTGTPRTMSLPPSDAIAQAAAAADGLAKALSTPQAHEMANSNGSAPTSRAQTPQPMALNSISTPIQLSQSSYTKVHISASPVSAPTRRIDLSTSRSMARLRSKDLQGEVFVLVTADADVPKETTEPPRPGSASPSAAATSQPGKDSAASLPVPVSGPHPKTPRPEGLRLGARQPNAPSAVEVGAVEAAVTAEIPPPTASVSTSEMAEATQVDISESQTAGTSMLSGFITPPLSEADEVLAEFDDVESITSNFSDFEAGPSSSKAPADRVYVDLSGITPRTVIQRLPQDCLQVVIPISARRRDELIARGFYDPFRDDADVVVPPLRPKRLRPFTKSNATRVKGLRRGDTIDIMEPEELLNRFVHRPGPGLLEPLRSLMTADSLLNRTGRFPCGWKGCGSELASESLLERHVLARAHAAQGALIYPSLDMTIYLCYWRDCDQPCFNSVSNLLQHMRAQHISRWLVCPYNDCDLKCRNTSQLGRHVSTAHDGPNDQLRPRVDEPPAASSQCPDGLDPLPDSVRTDKLTTHAAAKKAFRTARDQDNARAKLRRLSWAPPDPQLHVEHGLQMMQLLENEEIPLETSTEVSRASEPLFLPNYSDEDDTPVVPRTVKPKRKLDPSPPTVSNRRSSMPKPSPPKRRRLIRGSPASRLTRHSMTGCDSEEDLGEDELNLFAQSDTDSDGIEIIEVDSPPPPRRSRPQPKPQPTQRTRLVPFVEIELPVYSRRKSMPYVKIQAPKRQRTAAR